MPLKHEPETLSTIVVELFLEGDAIVWLKSVMVVVELLHPSDQPDFEEQHSVAESAFMKLPPQFVEIFRAELDLYSKKSYIFSDIARDTLATILNAGFFVRTLRLKFDANISMPIEDDIRWALEEINDKEIAILAIEAALRHEMTKEIHTAIDHQFAHVASRALTAVAASLAAPLPARLLALAEHRASPVRKALAEALKAKPNVAHKATLIKLARDQWSRYSIYDDNNSIYPIARIATSALFDVTPLTNADHLDLLAIAIDTSDKDLRYSIFLLLLNSDTRTQKNILNIAENPGRSVVRSSAAFALLQKHEHLEQIVIDRIHVNLLTTHYNPVTCIFAILIGLREEISAVRAVAEKLATSPKRRVLLLLILWALHDRDKGAAAEIATMLPPGHTAVAWALGEPVSEIDEAIIADLGDHAVCADVLHYMKINLDEPCNEKDEATIRGEVNMKQIVYAD